MATESHLTPKALQYFTQLAQNLNYTQTAQNLGISQPALTQQIKKLEKQIGAALFYSVGKKLYLSEAGNVLLAAANQIDTIINTTADQIQQFSQPQRGHIALGVLSSAETAVFERFVAHYLSRHDDVTVALRLFNRRELWEGLENNAIDLAVMYLPDENIRNWHLYAAQSIIQDELRFIYPASQNLGATIAIKDVPANRWVGYPDGFYIAARLAEVFRDALRDEPDVVATMVVPEQIALLAARIGLYSALPNSFLAAHPDSRLAAASFIPRVSLDLSFVYRKEKIAIPRVHTFMAEWQHFLAEKSYADRLAADPE